MHRIEAGLATVLQDIDRAAVTAHRDPRAVSLIAVSKTFDAAQIEPALLAGHRHFGENRVQESQGKWPGLRERFPDVVLHLIGPLQSNKAADAVALFDVIHSVDREKIAKTLSVEMEKQDRHLPVFVQVNTGREPQKAGVMPEETDAFVARCRDGLGLSVKGLMCIPPVDEPCEPHFALLREIANRNDLSDLSMGMSADYRQAIGEGSTFVRVGSAIFGARSQPGV